MPSNETARFAHWGLSRQRPGTPAHIAVGPPLLTPWLSASVTSTPDPWPRTEAREAEPCLDPVRRLYLEAEVRQAERLEVALGAMLGAVAGIGIALLL